MKYQVTTILLSSFLIVSCSTGGISSITSDSGVVDQTVGVQQESIDFVPGEFEKMVLKSKDEKMNDITSTNLPELSEKDKVYIEWKEFYLARKLWSQDLKDTEMEYRNSIMSQLGMRYNNVDINSIKDKWTQEFKLFQKSEQYTSYLKDNRSTIDLINGKLKELMPEGIPIEDTTFYIP